MPISKIFHDHIVMSNVDKHGVKQILYPRTTSDDVMMRDGNGTVTNNILTDFLSDVVHESNLIDTLDKDTLKNSEDKYLGEHLLGDTEDKILLLSPLKSKLLTKFKKALNFSIPHLFPSVNPFINSIIGLINSTKLFASEKTFLTFPIKSR